MHISLIGYLSRSRRIRCFPHTVLLRCRTRLYAKDFCFCTPYTASFGRDAHGVSAVWFGGICAATRPPISACRFCKAVSRGVSSPHARRLFRRVRSKYEWGTLETSGYPPTTAVNCQLKRLEVPNMVSRCLRRQQRVGEWRAWKALASRTSKLRTSSLSHFSANKSWPPRSHMQLATDTVQCKGESLSAESHSYRSWRQMFSSSFPQ